MGILLTKCGNFTYKMREFYLHYYFFLVHQTPINREYAKVIHTPITIFNKGF
jgi:hypothetical protein